MLTNAELNSKFETFSKDYEITKENVAMLKSGVCTITTTLEEMKVLMERLSTAVLGKKPIEESTGQEFGASNIHVFSSPNHQQSFEQIPPQPAPARLQENPGIVYVDRSAKLEVGDFHRDNNPELFLDWLHSLESFFRWYRLTDERKLFFAETKLMGTARVWWAKY